MAAAADEIGVEPIQATPVTISHSLYLPGNIQVTIQVYPVGK